MIIINRAFNLFKRVCGQPWIDEYHASCPRCENRTWLVTVHPDSCGRRRINRRVGLCKTCSLFINQYFEISKCPKCGAASYLMTGMGGKHHPFDQYTHPPSYECVRCGHGITSCPKCGEISYLMNGRGSGINSTDGTADPSLSVCWRCGHVDVK